MILDAPGHSARATKTRRSSSDWEALVGGNFLNKLGIFILVIGIALALGYSFTRVRPGGRVAMSLSASLAMLISGAVFEPREGIERLPACWAAAGPHSTLRSMRCMPSRPRRWFGMPSSQRRC